MPMPGMMPQQGAPTPGAMTGSLKSLPLDQLKMLYQNPQPGSPPLWAVISALAEKQKEAQAMQAAQGQSAMAQNAQMQQQPPVAAQVMQAAEQQQEPVMAAYGGEMHGYAGGGAVAFKDAGYVPPQEPGETFEEYRQRVIRYQDEQRAIEVAKKRTRAEEERVAELARRGGPSPASPFFAPAQSTTDTGDELMRMLGRAPAPVPIAMRDTRGVTPDTVAAARMLGAGQAQQRPPAAPAAAPAAPMPGISATLSPDEQRLFEARKAALEGRKILPPELLKGRAGLEALMKENLAAQRAEAKTFGDEARAARDAAIARSQRSLLDDPQALLAIAGGMDTRRGRGIGSLAQGAAGVMGQRQAAAEAARKEYATAQGTERLLQANIRQGSMLEAQRVQAMREGDYNRANQIDDAINQNAAERAKLERDVQNTAFAQRIDVDKLKTQQDQARAALISAGKPTGIEATYGLFKRDPTGFKQFLEAQQEPKSEATERAAMLKAIVGEAIKNPLMLNQYPPEIQTLVRNEIAKLGVVGAIPRGSAVRE
jgi:hypothetical protein